MSWTGPGLLTQSSPGIRFVNRPLRSVRPALSPSFAVLFASILVVIELSIAALADRSETLVPPHRTMDMALRLCATAGTASFTGRSLQIAKPSLQRSSSFAIAVHPLRLQSSLNLNKSSRNSVIVRAAGESVELDVKETGQTGDILPSGEWAENFSLLNYEDLTKHYEPVLFKPEVLASPNRLSRFSVYVYVCVCAWWIVLAWFCFGEF